MRTLHTAWEDVGGFPGTGAQGRTAHPLRL